MKNKTYKGSEWDGVLPRQGSKQLRNFHWTKQLRSRCLGLMSTKDVDEWFLHYF